MNNLSKRQLLEKISERKKDVRRARWLLDLISGDEQSVAYSKLPKFILDVKDGFTIKLYIVLLEFYLGDPESILQYKAQGRFQTIIVRKDLVEACEKAKSNAELIVRRGEEAIKKFEEELASRG